MLREIGTDVRGICTRPYIVGISGNLIYKALKKRLFSGVVLLGTLFYLGNRAFQFDFQGATIAVATLIVAVAGFGAQKWGSWALKRSLLHAEAHGANLLENKKKKRFVDIYLPELYTHVYLPEAKVQHEYQQLSAAAKRHESLFKHLVVDRLRRYTATAEARALMQAPKAAAEAINLPPLTKAERSGIEPGVFDSSGRVNSRMLNGVWLDLGEYVVRNNEVLMSALGFNAALRYSLARSDRQRDERSDIGIDLSFLEDYLDGACFHPNNIKIIEQARHSLMRQVEAAVQRPGIAEKIQRGWRQALQKRWHNYINTSVQASVGNLLYTIAKEYGTHSVAVEDVLWRDETERELLRQNLHSEFSAADEPQKIADQIIAQLDRETHRILTKIFHDTPAEAERVVRREYGYSVELSVARRVCYDLEYALGELPVGPVEDLQRVGASPHAMQRAKAQMDRAAVDWEQFQTRFSQNDFSERWQRYTPEMRRALRVAYYTDKAGFRQTVTDNGFKSMAVIQAADGLAQEFTPEASEKLRRLRLHHQLALFEYVDTLEQLIELVFTSQRKLAPPGPG